MRLLMRNWLNMYSNAKMEFLRKPVGQQRYPNQLYGSPPHIMYTFRHGNPLITDANKHPLRPCYLLDLKLGI